MIPRCPLTMPPCLTTPSIFEMTAVSRGLRASNSSATRGTPPVVFLAFVDSRGILAQDLAGRHHVAVLDHEVRVRRVWYLRAALPGV